jgi:ankyrin repeat protein
MLRYRPELARARDASSLSVLAFARYMERHDVLQMLLDAGPPLDIFDAAAIDRADIVRERLRDDPWLATAHSADGFTALHFGAYFGCLDAITALIEGGAQLEARTTNFLKNMPLHAAAAGGRIDAARLLLRYGADPNARQHGRNTPLMTAAFANNRALAELLIARNANVEFRNDEGKTAADVAAGLGNMELAARLRLGERHVERGQA